MSFVCRSDMVAANGLRVAAVGDFGALHCQPAQKFDSSTQLQFCTSPPIEATRCWQLVFCPLVFVNLCQCCVSVSLTVYIFVCLCWVVRCVFYFLKRGRKKFEILSRVAKVEALLQALVCALLCAACKCAYTCALG